LTAQPAGVASLAGRVVDSHSAVLPGAAVTVTSQTTGEVRDTTTNSRGEYLFGALPADTYSLKVDHPGFAQKLVTGLVVNVGQARVVDLKIDVAAPEQVVTVRDSDLPRNQLQAAVEDLISSEEISVLPLNGRNFMELALLVPGNTPAPNFDPTKTNSVVISSAGQLGRGGNVTLDGLDNNDDVVGGPLQNVSQEAVQEFQIATSRFSAEHGRTGSALINVVSRSGASDFHGSGSMFFRDRRLQALPATLDRTLDQDFPFDRQQYALGLGGPLVRDRAWWFGSLEHRNQDGALLTGERDPVARTIRRGFSQAPLNDLMASAKVDYNPGENDRLSGRLSLQRADDTTASTLIRSIGSASQRQLSDNNYESGIVSWTRVFSPTRLNSLQFGASSFVNKTHPIQPGPQLTYPSLQDGASFRVPQQTEQKRLQLSDTFSWMQAGHYMRAGVEAQRIDAGFLLDVFREGRIEFIQDFPEFDHNGDGRTDDNDLLFAVTLRSAFPDRSLDLPDADNTYLAFFIQDDWRLTPQLTLNLGLRYELDTDVKNISRVDQLNPIVLPFLSGRRGRDTNNWGPRVGFSWGPASGRTSVHGGYGIYYDRVVLQIQSLERGLDGRALPVEVRAGNVPFLDPETGSLPPGAPSLASPFTGFLLPGAGAAGINIIDNRLQNPMVQQFNLGLRQEVGQGTSLRVDLLHTLGTHFIIGRTIGTVFNPVVGGDDFVVNLESSVNTKYDALLLTLSQRFTERHQFRAAYTLSKAFNYANDDQIPFSNGPVDPNNLPREYGPPPNDQRHRLVLAGAFELPGASRLSLIWTGASGVPMDILLPSGLSRIPLIQRNAGGRQFRSPGELNEFLRRINEQGGIDGQLLPLVTDSARFSDAFHSVDLRLSRSWVVHEGLRVEPIVEVFNLFNTTNVLGVSNLNYSGHSNVLVRDSDDPTDPGYLLSSTFGRPVTTAGGVFGSGGPRAFQFAVKVSF